LHLIKAIPVWALTCNQVNQKSIKKFLDGEGTIQEASVLLDWVFSENGEKEVLYWMEQWWHDELERESPNYENQEGFHNLQAGRS
jgi:hypothetical protein